ncbi:39S ribosomal protein L35, mitochondrial [Anopheles nili]|uniref:39S ribosomal protein L35, mitochondrial n=1 Tax=Anopheles nili TaxID=185578 RepID=UPI00237B3E15|nr:39S ribosomal protein L35, mitochondrial [Anopheles nili]
MIRGIALTAIRQAVQARTIVSRLPSVPAAVVPLAGRSFSSFLRCNEGSSLRTVIAKTNGCSVPKPTASLRLLDSLQSIPTLQTQPSRTVIKFSLRKGKRKTVKAVVKRFKRLHWGGWIRTISGRHKKLWRKKGNRKRRLRQHVLVNGTQATLLDKMVTKYWKRPRYYIDDPYAPYHTREEFVYTRRKPLK